MNQTGAYSGSIPAACQQFFWRHPQWWAELLCAGAWIAMLVHGVAHAGHELEHTLGFFGEVMGWLVMVAAMTLPFVRGSLRFAALSSLWSRRHRAMLAYLAGFLLSWVPAGVVIGFVRTRPWSHTYWLPAVFFALAVVWQTTQAQRRAMMEAHGTYPIALTGFHADRTCVLYGVKIAFATMRSCWPVMLACAFAGHAVLAVAGGVAVEYLSQTAPPFRRPWAPLVLSGFLAAIYVVLAFASAGGAVRHH